MKKIAVYLFGAINILAIIYFWFGTSGHLLGTGSLANNLIYLGRLFGLLAVYFLLAQLILIGRVGWVEKIFGMDKLSRLHHWNGLFTLSFMVLHPVFLIFGYGALANNSFLKQFFAFYNGWQDMGGAVLGLALFLAVVFFSIAMVKIHLKYELWYFIHLASYLAILVAIGHQFSNGADLQAKAAYGYWVILYFFVFLNFLLFRFIRPVFNFARFRFYVDHLAMETDDSVSVYIKGKNLEGFKIQPGQFMIFRFLAWPYVYEAHPFSLSNFPEGEELRITVKNEGDFTAKVKNIKPGTKVLIDGPNGIFTEKVAQRKKALMIAGGVGITPIRSLIESMLKKDYDLSLIFGNRTLKDIIFKEELKKLCQSKHFPIFHVLSGEKGGQTITGKEVEGSFPEVGDWTGLTGRIDLEKIKTLAPDFMERDIYLCGPPAMMDSIKKQLKSAGFDLGALHFEKFSL